MKLNLYFFCAISLFFILFKPEAPVITAQSYDEPELPRVLVDTKFVLPVGRSISVHAGGNLQAAINEAMPGDEIVLEAGASFMGSFSLPNKSGDEWIVIRSSDMSALPPEGARIRPEMAASMPKLLAQYNNTAVLRTEPGAHNYRIVGIEMTAGPGVTLLGDIVKLGDGTSAQKTFDSIPHDLIIDRCYIHGTPTLPVRRGVSLNSALSAIIDSHISDIHVVGQDTQAIGGWNGPGPYKIANNYLEAAGENIMFGGGDPKIENLLPSDIEIRRNHFFKPLSWKKDDPSYQGIHWTVKNLFELKLGRRVLVEGNVFENSWTDAQIGYALLIKTSNQEGSAPWSTTEDVTIANNKVLNANVGVQLARTSGVHPNQGVRRVKVVNNLFRQIHGDFVRISDGPADIRIDHNTAFQTGKVISLSGTPGSGFIFTNNISPHNRYGVKGDGQPVGTGSLNVYSPSHVFAGNAVVGGKASLYPEGNLFPLTLDEVGFVDMAGGNYRLIESSPCRNAGTDGLDIGADIDKIEEAISSTGDLPNPGQKPQVSVSLTPEQGIAPLTVNFTGTASDSDGQIVSYRWDFGDGQTSNEASPWHVYQTSGVFTATLTVTDNSGMMASDSAQITVSLPNQPPQVTISMSQTKGFAPLTVNFSSNASDPDGQIVSYHWDFGDGQSLSEASPDHTYLTTGVFNARLTVRDDAGAAAQDELTITVEAIIPVQVKVITPNSREKLLSGSVHEIKWEVKGSNILRQHIQLSIDGGWSWQDVAVDIPGTANSYSWNVPAIRARKALIRVLAFNAQGLAGEDRSDTYFTILGSMKLKKKSASK